MDCPRIWRRRTVIPTTSLAQTNEKLFEIEIEIFRWISALLDDHLIKIESELAGPCRELAVSIHLCHMSRRNSSSYRIIISLGTPLSERDRTRDNQNAEKRRLPSWHWQYCNVVRCWLCCVALCDVELLYDMPRKGLTRSGNIGLSHWTCYIPNIHLTDNPIASFLLLLTVSIFLLLLFYLDYFSTCLYFPTISIVLFAHSSLLRLPLFYWVYTAGLRR